MKRLLKMSKDVRFMFVFSVQELEDSNGEGDLFIDAFKILL